MDRREMLQSAAALTLVAVAVPASSAEDHSHHHHHDGGSPNQALLRSASDCITTGEVCLAHCLVLLGEGDDTLAGCSKSVNQMLAMCAALRSLAAQQSKYTPALAKVALDVCTDCEKECRKHEKDHAECKACADSCTECIKQCKALAA